MKITDVKPLLVKPRKDAPPWASWLMVRVETDEGITGLGEATNQPGGGTLVLADAVKHLRESVVGEDPNDIDRLWNKVYRRFTFLGSRGFATSLIAGLDIALWDIKGKALGRPIYDLLGGRFRDRISLYANVWFTDCTTPEDYALAARRTVSRGFTALKMDPFHEMRPYLAAVQGAVGVGAASGYVNGVISPQGEQAGIEITAAVRDAVGPGVEIFIDAHGMYNVASAIRIGRRLAPYQIGWLEEPLPPENHNALRQVRESIDIPISLGERLYTRYDFVPVLENHLADYIMPDVVWTGGISELRKIANMAEAYYIPVCPHTVFGPIHVLASAHAMMSVPNFYRTEFNVSSLEVYNKLLDRPLDVRDGCIYLPHRPGLGYELQEDFVRAHAVDVGT